MFRQLTENVWVAPQIDTAQVAEAAAMGIGIIVNNRPEGESDDQPPGSAIAAAAAAAGLAYVAIPVTHSGFSESQVSAMAEALGGEGRRVLAYCRSGTRSTLLWALARASGGAAPADLAEQAGAAGYDLAPVQPLLDMLAARARG